jgi:hypothetical protein
MMNTDLIPAKINDAIQAIGSVQTYLLENNLTMPCYALESAHQNIKSIQKLLEGGDLVTRQKVVDYAYIFGRYHDDSQRFTAENFLADFDEFESGECDD